MEALAAGRLVLHPTETVVSLTGDPYDAVAVAAARSVKGYDRPRPFLCLVGDVDAARALASGWPDAARRLAEAFWPGPLTLVVPAGADAPQPVVDAGRLALRLASDDVSARLVSAWGRPLFSTSANPRGESPARRVAEAIRALEGAPGSGAIAVALEEPPGAEPAEGEPSTIVDVSTAPPRVIRVGAVALEEVREVVEVTGA